MGGDTSAIDVAAACLQVYKMCMSIGWNPFYQNKEKTAEPWVLHDFDKVRTFC
jgi:FAD synthase